MVTPKDQVIFHSVAAQLVTVEAGVVIKRGAMSLLVRGENVGLVVAEIFDVARTGISHGALSSHILNTYPSVEQGPLDRLLDELIRHRLLSDKVKPLSTSMNENVEVFFWHFERGGGETMEKLKYFPITVIGHNHVGTQLAFNLVQCGCQNVTLVDHDELRNPQVSNEATWLKFLQQRTKITSYDEWKKEAQSEQRQFLCVASDFGPVALMHEWNRNAVRIGFTFTTAFLHDHKGYVGPIVDSDEVACFSCFRTRQNANLVSEDLIQTIEEIDDAKKNTASFLPPMPHAVGAWAATEIIKFYCESLVRKMTDRVLIMDFLTGESKARRVLKVPRCPVCSVAARVAASE